METTRITTDNLTALKCPHLNNLLFRDTDDYGYLEIMGLIQKYILFLF